MPSFLQNIGRSAYNFGTRNRLPELGISEAFGYQQPVTLRDSGIRPTQGQYATQSFPSNPPRQPVPPSGMPRISPSPTSGGNAQAPAVTQQPNYGQVDQWANDYDAIIEQEYNQRLSDLGQQESGIRSQADLARSQINTDYQNVFNQINREQGVAEEGVNTQLQTGEKEAKSALQQARDLFRQTQQSNIAQLSGLGISSSSVSEALAERLGVETSRRISGVSGNLTEIRNNATKEMSRIRNYYQGKLSAIETDKANREQEINLGLMEAVKRIQSDRNQSSIAKAQKRLDLFYDAQRQKGEMLQAYEKFQQSLALWAERKASALEPLSAGDWNTIFEGQMTGLRERFTPDSFDLNPSYSVDRYGNIQGQISVKRREEEEENSLNPESTNFWNRT